MHKPNIWTPRNVCASGFFQFGDFGFQQAAAAAAGGGGSSFDPAATAALWPLGVNPIADNVTKDGGDLVSALAETGTAAKSWVQATGSLQPLWEVDGVGSKPSLGFLFDTSTDYLARADGAIADYFTTTDCYMVFVVKPLAVTGSEKLIMRFAQGGITLRRNVNVFRASWYDGAEKFAASTVTLTANQTYIVSVRVTGGKLDIAVNDGAWEGDTTVGANTLGSAREWDMGDNSGSDAGNKLGYMLAGTWAAFGGDHTSLVASMMTYWGIG